VIIIYNRRILDGPGEGFGNKISIQIVDLVRIGKKTGKMYNFPTTKYVSLLGTVLGIALD